jgi:hypothetical protein
VLRFIADCASSGGNTLQLRICARFGHAREDHNDRRGIRPRNPANAYTCRRFISGLFVLPSLLTLMDSVGPKVAFEVP